MSWFQWVTTPVLQAQSLRQNIHTLLEDFYETGHFEGVALVAQHGKVIYEGTFGHADREWQIPHRPDGKFVIGSLSKQFIAALALVLQQNGMLQLDTTIDQYLPDFPNPALAQRVTVRHLLSSTSGLPHYRAWENFLQNRDRLPYTREELLALFKDLELAFEPGAAHQYSSLGYLLAGFVLEEAGGKPLGELLIKYVFEPAEMSDSSLDDHSTILDHRVRPYRYDYKNGYYMNANYRDPSTTFSAGGIITTARDLLRWDRVLTGTELLHAQSKTELVQPVHENYALGWRTRLNGLADSVQIHWHSGMVTGYRSCMVRLPEQGYCIILLSNMRDMADEDIRQQIINLLHGQPTEKPRYSLLKRLLRETVEQGPQTAIELYHELKEQHHSAYTFSEVELLVLALEMNSEGMHSYSIPFLNLCLKEYPESPYLFNNWVIMGNTHRELGQNSEAIRCYREALNIRPEAQGVQDALNALE